MMSNNIKVILSIAFLFLCPMLIHAEDIDSRYLKRTVPETNGKVVFTETIETSKDSNEIYQLIQEWLTNSNSTDSDFYKNKIIYSDSLKNELVAQVEDRLIFTKTAFNLDYALVSYYLLFEIENNKCKITIRNIKYEYYDFENTKSADELITDKKALNKTQTELIKGNDKFRIATIDMVDQIYNQLNELLNKEELEVLKKRYESRRSKKGNTIAVASQIKETEDGTSVKTIRDKKPNITNSDNKQSIGKKITFVTRYEDFAQNNFFIINNNSTYIKQLNAISVSNKEGQFVVSGYANKYRFNTPSSSIISSQEFKILYTSPNSDDYNKLVELSKKYATGNSLTEADITLIETITNRANIGIDIDNVEIETVATDQVNNNPTITTTTKVGELIETDDCIVIKGKNID